ncbi:hypothetical protein GCM10027614_25400 [Micromonospora vulcania]
MTGAPDLIARNGGGLDGFHIGYLPDVADLVSDFQSECGGRQLRHPGLGAPGRGRAPGRPAGARVRGDRLGTLAELREFLAEYHERDPADWTLTEFQHGESPA